MTRTHATRSGVAAVWALVVLSLVSALSVAAVTRFAAARKQIDLARNRTQAEWLARSGYELAVARLLTKPDGYTGETVSPVPTGEVKIVVTPDPKDPTRFHVECTARYPVGGPAVAIQTLRRSFPPDEPAAP